jgi:hypothetical protein
VYIHTESERGRKIAVRKKNEMKERKKTMKKKRFNSIEAVDVEEEDI